MPAVSMNRHSLPPRVMSSSTGSTVVPATSLTTTRSSLATLFSSEDLPTFGLPTIATRRGPPASASRSGGASGSASRTASSMSPVPRPCIADTGNGSPIPRLHRFIASDSIRWSSTLFAASTTGLPAFRSTRTTASSASVMPTVASTTNSTASAALMAISACAATRAAIPTASGSQPPVSTTVNSRPAQLASYDTRSRVTPGVSSTTASRRPMMRLTSVDLPTFGRPTIASTGSGPLSSRSCVGTSVGRSVIRVLLVWPARERVAGGFDRRLHVGAQHVADPVGGRQYVGMSPGKGYAVHGERLAVHHVDPASGRRAALVVARGQPRAEQCHREDRRPGDHRQVRHTGPDPAEVTRAAGALRADVQHPAVAEHLDRLADCERVVRRPVDRDLAEPVQELALHPAEHLDLAELVQHPGRNRPEQRRVQQAQVVRRHQQRAGHREPALVVDRQVVLPPEVRLRDLSQRQRQPVRQRWQIIGPRRLAVQIFAPGDLYSPDSRPRGTASASFASRLITSTTSSSDRYVESMVTAPSEATWNSDTVESSASRRTIWSRSSSAVTDPAASSAPRRAIRASWSAVSNTLSSASVATTVAMSRPSTTIPPLGWAASMIARCRRTSSLRTSRLVAILETTALIPGSRIAAVTSVPSAITNWFPGSVLISSRRSRARCATAAVSSRSRPCAMADQVTARYVAPVSRNRRPSRLATPRAVLDLPDPLGPSTAMIMPRRLPSRGDNPGTYRWTTQPRSVSTSTNWSTDPGLTASSTSPTGRPGL